MTDSLPSNDANNRNPLPLTFILSRQGRGEFWRYSKSFSRLLIPNAKLDNCRFDDYLSMEFNRREVCLYEGEATS
jgi:hypothetical protein